MIQAGPCDTWDLISCCDLDSTSPAVTGAAAQAATEIMWALSGRQFGTCTVTTRPCRDECGPEYNLAYPFSDTYWPHPALIRGLWYNLGCDGGCSGGCSCNTVSEFTLPRPISSIVNITIDGAQLVTGAYRVDNYRKVVRIDGGQWPFCNDLSIDSGPGAWSVTVKYGVEPPQLALMAGGELMCELVKACAGDKTCKLPARVQTITRQGVTVGFIDPQEFVKEGLTGLYLPDLFIRTFNPARLASPSQVYSPDLPYPRVRTS